MISKKEVLKIHSILIDQFGGSHGVRDYDLLDSAINRPMATFGNEELYPTPIDKAAAILESIVKNHPFIDGNKRTGYVLARLLLLQSQLDINVSQEEKYKMVISISTGKMNFEQIRDWFLRYTE
ncbi:type II toxin-antitoxin system death-on-curing family toxin [Marivirga sp. S37H4]|uniref:Type II toxin-antitoxin system death-on-curing family toxin n=1 Tax=Marivirga aurantiaca TaxID=2802615 RepID=A0A934WXP3_9BACT|nr:type II toxin-antitoxin system death-on-curing family toxin [Marivirga aurantiaca]MBK6265068.1 type II toxin-antitoxin system death-on-curing family toxin [Marivirga aurantiaca]